MAEKMLDRVVCSGEQFSFQMCLESGDGSGTSRIRRQRVPDSRCRDTECFGLKVDPCHLGRGDSGDRLLNGRRSPLSTLLAPPLPQNPTGISYIAFR